MFDIIWFFWQVCLLKKGPQDARHSYFLLQYSGFLYATVSLLLLQLSISWAEAIAQISVEIILLAAFAYSMLFINNKLSRLSQTVTALLGSDAIISFLALPAFSVISTGRATDLPYILILLLIVWHWLVIGHILRHALNNYLPTALAIAFLYIYFSYQLMAWLFS